MTRASRSMILGLALLAVLPAAALAVGPDGPEAPQRLELDVPGPQASENPRVVDRALALFPDDAFNRALVCPRQRAATQPADPQTTRCAYDPVATLRVGTTLLWAARARFTWEHDGMYGFDDDIVLLEPRTIGAPRVLHTLTQVGLDVVDCGTTLRMRRMRVVDLDGDGESELCIESVAESGAGLFTVMELGAHNRRWYPAERSRGIDAFRLQRGGGLVREPTLDGECPSRGYRPFVSVPPRRQHDPLQWRQSVQGDDRASQRRGCRLHQGCPHDRTGMPNTPDQRPRCPGQQTRRPVDEDE